MTTILDAHGFALAAHAGQIDKGGQPYIRHLERVANLAQARAGHARQIDGLALDPAVVSQAALLHDVLEDTTKTAADLRAAGFPDAVVAIVVRLTKPARRTAYSERITALIASGDLAAILIKMSDNEDNMCPARVLPDVGYLRERYATAFARLRAAAGELGYTGR